MLSPLHHQNQVNPIGYCADKDQILLVYECMPLKSREDHLLDKMLLACAISTEIKKLIVRLKKLSLAGHYEISVWETKTQNK